MDSLIQKALAVSRLTAQFPVDTIFSATVWFEEMMVISLDNIDVQLSPFN